MRPNNSGPHGEGGQAVDQATHDIVAAEVTLENAHNAQVLPVLLNPLRYKLGRVYTVVPMKAKPTIG